MIVIGLINTLFAVKNGIMLSNPFSTDILKVLKEPFDIKKRGIDVNSIFSDPDGIPDKRISDFGNITLYANETEGIAYERAQFQLVLVFLSCFSCMVLTDWGNPNGAPLSLSDGNHGMLLTFLYLSISIYI